MREGQKVKKILIYLKNDIGSSEEDETLQSSLTSTLLDFTVS
jgi:hypothetical protein